MTITWLGLSSFLIETKQLDREVNLLVDPYQNETGLRFPRTMEAAIIASSRDHENQNNLSAIEGKPFKITGPGEYEVQGIFVYGIEAPRNGKKEGVKEPHSIFRIETEGISLAHLGALNRPLTDKELEQLPSIDVLMVPVGGEDVLTANQAKQIIEEIEPRIVIPMYYAIPGLKENLASLQDFLKEYGAANSEQLPKLKLKRADLPQEQTLVKILERP